MKNETIVRYTAKEIEELIERGEDRTDYARLDAMTPEDVEAQVSEEELLEFDWSTAQIGIPEPNQQSTVRLDQDVIDLFKAQGSGYQTRINAVLKSYVDAQRVKNGIN